jgi:hypothetical protein
MESPRRTSALEKQSNREARKERKEFYKKKQEQAPFLMLFHESHRVPGVLREAPRSVRLRSGWRFVKHFKTLIDEITLWIDQNRSSSPARPAM